MDYLDTAPIKVGEQTFILSEFTGLDRLLDMQFAIENPVEPRQESSDSPEFRLSLLRQEEQHFRQLAHSLSLSLRHAHPAPEGVSDAQHLQDLQAMITKKWGFRKAFEASLLVRALNSPPQGMTTPSTSDAEPPTPEKP